MAELSEFKLHAGDPCPDFTLPGTDGRLHRRDDFSSRPWLVVAFWCNHCPYVQAWEGRLLELARQYAEQGAAFVLINSNDDRAYPTDDFEHMKARAVEKAYPCPYLRDSTQEVARAFGALVTPHLYLFGPDRRLRFQGPIDDNHREPDRVRNRYLADALDAATAGRSVSKAELPVLGCSVKWRS